MEWVQHHLKTLTSVDLLQGDVLLQQPPEFDLGAVFPTSPVVSEDEMGVAVVEHRQLAQWVCHRLIGPGHLEEGASQVIQERTHS